MTHVCVARRQWVNFDTDLQPAEFALASQLDALHGQPDHFLTLYVGDLERQHHNALRINYNNITYWHDLYATYQKKNTAAYIIENNI